jgi:protein-disulfide isomerase
MDRLLIAVAIVAVAVLVALAIRRRRRPDAPAQVTRAVPSQLDRADFERPDAKWLVAVFTSATCGSCADVVAAARRLAGVDVAVVDVEYQAQRPLHERYGVEAVPMLVIADAEGVVRANVFGPVGAEEVAQAFAAASAAR